MCRYITRKSPISTKTKSIERYISQLEQLEINRKNEILLIKYEEGSAQLQKQIEQLDNKNREYEVIISKYSNSVKVLQANIKHLEAANQTLKEQTERTISKSEESKEETDKLKIKIVALQNTLSQKEAALKTQNDAYERLQYQAQDIGEEREKLGQVVQRLSKQLDEKKAEVTKCAAKYTHLDKDVVRKLKSEVVSKDNEIKSLKEIIKQNLTALKKKDAEGVKVESPVRVLQKVKNISHIKKQEDKADVNKVSDTISDKVETNNALKQEPGGSEEDVFRKNYSKQIDNYYQNLEDRAVKYNNSQKVRDILSLGYDYKWPARNKKASKHEDDGNEFDRDEEDKVKLEEATLPTDVPNVSEVIRSSIEKVKERNSKAGVLPPIYLSPKLGKEVKDPKHKKLST